LSRPHGRDPHERSESEEQRDSHERSESEEQRDSQEACSADSLAVTRVTQW